MGKIEKLESKVTTKTHEKALEAISIQIASLRTQLKEKTQQENLLKSRQPLPFWVRQSQSVQDNSVRAHVTVNRMWDTLAIGKVLTGFMRDVFAPVLGVSGNTEVHAAKEMVHQISNVIEQRNARAHDRMQSFPIANVLDAIRSLLDIALRCQKLSDKNANTVEKATEVKPYSKERAGSNANDDSAHSETKAVGYETMIQKETVGCTAVQQLAGIHEQASCCTVPN